MANKNESQESISIVCACMNRSKPLKACIGSWLLDSRINEILIIDWSSSPKLKLDNLDPRIRIVRIDGEKYFNLGKAYNLGFKLAKSSKIMKMDTDYFINPYYDLIGELPLPKSNFYTGNWMLHKFDGDMGFFRFTNGWLYIDKEDFLNVGGYREDLKGYGFDDSDLYQRLIQSGIARATLNLNSKPLLFHVPHNANLRVENYENKNIRETMQYNRDLCINANNQPKVDH